MTTQLWTDCAVATLQPGADRPYGLIDDAALVLDGEFVRWVGPRSELPTELRARCQQQHDAGGALITPGLIDCHTHLVYAGDRAREFELRLNGATYEEIARSGGGIASTVRATRAASAEALQAQSRVRLQALLAQGVTTVEIKSGYGLALESERRMLQVARALGRELPVSVCTTFLGAHAVPPEFAGRSDDYVDAVLAMLPQLHAEGLVDAVDAFCEGIGFSPAQTRRVFAAAQALGLPVKLHAEQLSDSGGAALAAGFQALSCDHLEWLSEEGAAAMAAGEGGVVWVWLLPGMPPLSAKAQNAAASHWRRPAFSAPPAASVRRRQSRFQVAGRLRLRVRRSHSRSAGPRPPPVRPGPGGPTVGTISRVQVPGSSPTRSQSSPPPIRSR